MASDQLEYLRNIDLTEVTEDTHGPVLTEFDHENIHTVEERDTQYKYWLSSYAKARVMSNQNFILLIVGPTGSGKSYSAMEVARDMDQGFTTERIVFYPEDFIRITKQGLPPGSVIMWDEVGVGLSSRDWWSIQNKMIAYVLETFRRDRIILIMTTPNVGFIDKKVRALLHGFAETIDKTFTGDKFGYVKYFHIISNLREGKMMYRYPRIRDKHGRTRVIRGKTSTSGNMRFTLPPEWLTEPYEEMKMVFTESLKDKALEILSESSSTSSKMEIEDIINNLQENPGEYGLHDDAGITHIVNKAYIKLSMNHKHKKVTKSNVDAVVRYVMQESGIEVQTDASILDDNMIEVVLAAYEIETDVRGVAKALGEDKAKVQRSIRDWKKRGLWVD